MLNSYPKSHFFLLLFKIHLCLYFVIISRTPFSFNLYPISLSVYYLSLSKSMQFFCIFVHYNPLSRVSLFRLLIFIIVKPKYKDLSLFLSSLYLYVATFISFIYFQVCSSFILPFLVSACLSILIHILLSQFMHPFLVGLIDITICYSS